MIHRRIATHLIDEAAGIWDEHSGVHFRTYEQLDEQPLALEKLPWYLCQAGAVTDCIQLLCDLRFLRRRVQNQLTEDHVEDCRRCSLLPFSCTVLACKLFPAGPHPDMCLISTCWLSRSLLLGSGAIRIRNIVLQHPHFFYNILNSSAQTTISLQHPVWVSFFLCNSSIWLCRSLALLTDSMKETFEGQDLEVSFVEAYYFFLKFVCHCGMVLLAKRMYAGMLYLYGRMRWSSWQRESILSGSVHLVLSDGPCGTEKVYGNKLCAFSTI